MPKDNFSKDEQNRIISAIKNAENRTSGEIRVHIESQCKGGDPLERAKKIFERLNMHKTELRNGVLFYISLEDHRFAICGDKGIHTNTPEGFWDNIKLAMLEHLKKQDIVHALETGIEMAGKALKEHFPVADDDINELSDEISFGE